MACPRAGHRVQVRGGLLRAERGSFGGAMARGSISPIGGGPPAERAWSAGPPSGTRCRWSTWRRRSRARGKWARGTQAEISQAAGRVVDRDGRRTRSGRGKGQQQRAGCSHGDLRKSHERSVTHGKPGGRSRPLTNFKRRLRSGSYCFSSDCNILPRMRKQFWSRGGSVLFRCWGARRPRRTSAELSRAQLSIPVAR